MRKGVWKEGKPLLYFYSGQNEASSHFIVNGSERCGQNTSQFKTGVLDNNDLKCIQQYMCTCVSANIYLSISIPIHPPPRNTVYYMTILVSDLDAAAHQLVCVIHALSFALLLLVLPLAK